MAGAACERAARDGVGDHELGMVGVLILVDQHVAIPLLQRRADLVVMTHEAGGVAEQIVEVDLLERAIVSQRVKMNLWAVDKAQNSISLGECALAARLTAPL